MSWAAVLVTVFVVSFLGTTILIRAFEDAAQTFPAAGCFELRTTDSTRVGEGPDATERWQTVERVEWVCP